MESDEARRQSPCPHVSHPEEASAVSVRHLLFKDVMTYKAEYRHPRRAALDELTRLDQEPGLS
jgi:hypothetical protein